MKRLYIFFSGIIVLYIIVLNCQQTGGSGGGGGKGGGGDDDPPSKWVSQLKKIVSDAEDGDCFGYSVSISGDYAIAGTRSQDDGRGAAYIFHRTGTNIWETGFKITASDAEESDFFGHSVSISGDYAIVGAFQKGGGGTGRGAAYIFQRTGINTWEEMKKITASDGVDNDYFGCSVSISGNYAIVGAYNQDCGGINRGAAYVYRRLLNTWDEMAKITASDIADFDNFGCSVSISGDYVIIGAVRQAESTGSVYIYYRSLLLDTWVFGTKITASDAEEGDYFGCSVSISGDYAIVGANQNDGGGSSRGAAYIFYRTGTGIYDTGIKITAPDSADFDIFGCSVSISGDYVIIGANRKSGNRGAAYIFHRIGTNIWDTGRKITAYDSADGDEFGSSVSISGDYAIIGVPYVDGIGSSRGAVYIIK